MMGFSINQAKTMFFDLKKVKDPVDLATQKVLSRFGAYVRTTARQSIRKRKGPSVPGSPPHSHTGLLKRFIFFAYDRVARNVVIGPARIMSVKSRRKARSRMATIGGGGPIRFGGRPAANTKIFRLADSSRTVAVTFAKMRTATQVERANRLWDILGNDITSRADRDRRFQMRRGKQAFSLFIPSGKAPELLEYGARFPARPYMHPAFEKEKPKLPGMWANSVKP